MTDPDFVILGKTVEMCKFSIGLIGRRPSIANSNSPQDLSEWPSWEQKQCLCSSAPADHFACYKVC